jgi:hypothetical protein
VADQNQVEVYNPQGKLGMVPSSQLDAAKSQGYKAKSDYVEVVHPKTGKTGIIPKDQWGDDKKPGAAQTQGFVMSPREQQRAAKSKAAAGMKPSYAAMGITNAPTGADPHNPANPNVNAIVPGVSLAKPENMAPAREAVSTGLAKTQAGILAGQGVNAGAGAVIGKLTAPTVSTEMVESGLLGPSGKALFKESLKYGPSAMDKALANPVAKQILGWVGKGVGVAAAWKAIEALGLTKSKGPAVP